MLAVPIKKPIKKPIDRSHKIKKKTQTSVLAPKLPTQAQEEDARTRAQTKWKEELDKLVKAIQAAGGRATGVNTGKAATTLSTRLPVHSHIHGWNAMRTLSRYLGDKDTDVCMRQLWISDNFVLMMEMNPVAFVKHFHAKINAGEKAKRAAKQSPPPIPTGLAQKGALIPNECTAGKGNGKNALSRTTNFS